MLILIGAFLSGCSSTRFESSWKDPETKTLAFTKLMVITPYPDGTIRRQAEDALKAAITTVPVVTSYQSLSTPESLRDVQAIIAAAKQAGADGVVTVRLVSDRTELEYSHGMTYPVAYHSMSGYWGVRYGLAPMAYVPPVVTAARMVAIETGIYRVADGKLAWSGLTSTRDPTSITTLINETVVVVSERLQQDGLIAKP
ncbi:MAG TPA: hypothetical protein VHX44_16545 [Planctomycetota bacterium]|nr:hypothetical protein [Planctomycetota bacterium]